jgi:hypothetical protein
MSTNVEVDRPCPSAIDGEIAAICRRCNTVEECYEFMLAYAAQGVSSANSSQSGGRIREVLEQAVDALSGLADVCTAAVKAEGLEPAAKYLAFFAVTERDARDALAAIELVLAQPVISSQLIDNLNASLHLRAVLTDLFLLGDIIRQQMQAAIATR